MCLQQIFPTLTQGCQHICHLSPPHCLSPPTRDACFFFIVEGIKADVGGSRKVQMGYLLDVWNKHFLVVLMMSPLLPPLSSTPSCLISIANFMSMPMTGQGWVGSSTASNSTHPTIIDDTPWQLMIHHVDQPQYPHPWPPTGNYTTPWPPRLWQAPHRQSCTALTPHDLPNLAGPHGSVNWHLHCTCEVYWSILWGYPWTGLCTPRFF